MSTAEDENWKALQSFLLSKPPEREPRVVSGETFEDWRSLRREGLSPRGENAYSIFVDCNLEASAYPGSASTFAVFIGCQVDQVMNVSHCFDAHLFIDSACAFHSMPVSYDMYTVFERCELSGIELEDFHHSSKGAGWAFGSYLTPMSSPDRVKVPDSPPFLGPDFFLAQSSETNSTFWASLDFAIRGGFPFSRSASVGVDERLGFFEIMVKRRPWKLHGSGSPRDGSGCLWLSLGYPVSNLDYTWVRVSWRGSELCIASAQRWFLWAERVLNRGDGVLHLPGSSRWKQLS